MSVKRLVPGRIRRTVQGDHPASAVGFGCVACTRLPSVAHHLCRRGRPKEDVGAATMKWAQTLGQEMDNKILPVRCPANHDIPDPRCKLKFGAQA